MYFPCLVPEIILGVVSETKSIYNTLNWRNENDPFFRMWNLWQRPTTVGPWEAQGKKPRNQSPIKVGSLRLDPSLEGEGFISAAKKNIKFDLFIKHKCINVAYFVTLTSFTSFHLRVFVLSQMFINKTSILSFLPFYH